MIYMCRTDFHFCYEIQIVPILFLFSAPYQSCLQNFFIPWAVR